MAKSQIATELTAATLRQLLSYDSETGKFTWRVGGGVKAGQRAGYTNERGYRRIKILGRAYREHRLAWLYMLGQWPAEEIDHSDGNRANNRWRNLRAADHSFNQQNLRAPRRQVTSTGLLGVHRTTKGKFASKIMARGVLHWLGTFDAPSIAHDAYIAAKRRLHEGCTI